MAEIVGIYFWLAWSLCVAVAADTRGRNWTIWFVFALVLSPFVAGPLMLAMPIRS